MLDGQILASYLPESRAADLQERVQYKRLRIAACSCLQKEEAASQQQELDRVQRAYENLKAQERQLEESLSHISEEVKGMTLPIRLAAATWSMCGSSSATLNV